MYTLTGAGSDIWNTADGFQFAFTTLTGDGSISDASHVDGELRELRQSWDHDAQLAGSEFCLCDCFFDTTGNGEFRRTSVQRRVVGQSSKPGHVLHTEWLKLSRSGNAFLRLLLRQRHVVDPARQQFYHRDGQHHLCGADHQRPQQQPVGYRHVRQHRVDRGRQSTPHSGDSSRGQPIAGAQCSDPRI